MSTDRARPQALQVGLTFRPMLAKAGALLLGLVLPCLIGAGSAAAQERGEVKATYLPAATRPHEMAMQRAGSVEIDLRRLPQVKPRKFERPELEEPDPEPVELPGVPPLAAPAPRMNVPLAAAPAPSASFDGLDFATWGAGHPPDPVGDVGPTYFMQAMNTSIGIYSKSGSQIAAFTFDAFMSQGNFGNLCDTNNFGDPVVLYDTFEDRWIITDFAFEVDGSGNIVNPPGAFQCFAVSKSGDPVSGGWNFYSIHIANGLGDYPKFGIWPDGLYMSANVFGYPSGAPFQNPRVFALNKAQMYAGAPTVQVVTFDAPAADFALLPSNARLQTGTPPAGSPNYFVSTWQFTNALSVYKFHVDWNRLSTSTFTGPDTPLAATSWPNASVPNAPSLGGNSLDVLQIRGMMQNQYTNFGGVESLWAAHTVRRQNTTGFAAPRWYQVTVTGGTVAAALPQATTWDPDGANVTYRFVPSLAIDRAGDMALGYSTSNSTTKPAVRYAGRLATDPVNTFSQTEQLFFQGTGTQTGNCGGSACIRWGDYTGMALDPDGCTFWLTNEYYGVDGLNFLTRVGSFSYPSCTPVGAGGTLSGTVTATVGGAPIAGATVRLGSRTTTTDGAGSYAFASLPAGTYPTASASDPGSVSSTASGIVVSDGNTTTQNFSLATADTSACLTDTTQADFQTGTPTNVDLTASPGDVVLAKPDIDQQSTTLGTSGVGITTTTWGGQTFTPSRSGTLTAADINLFCSGCTGTTPNLTLSLRATSGGLPTGADLAAATITGFSSGAAAFYTATFSSPPSLTAGTQYAIVIRPTANPSPGTYALTRSGTSTAGSDVYPGGSRVSGATSGTVWSIPLTGGVSTDAGFKIHVDSGFGSSGDLISGVKDSNPPAGDTPTWTTLSWTATVPANTTLQFQAAASNSPSGPFAFVGPDGTAATYFTTSGASLSQFNGFQYLEYRAFFATSDATVSPTLNDVTACYDDEAPPDLGITVTDGVTEATPGGSVTYTINASNSSPLPATGATVADTFPAALTCTWTCVGAGGGTCTAAGSGNINDTVNLPAGASVTYTASCTISAAATGTISDTATVSFATDPNPANNSGTDTDTLTPQADLAITATDGVTTATPGGSVTYTITGSNAGPSNATGATVADTFPASLTCTWTCVGAGGGTCTAAGSGNINGTVNLPAGASVTYTASCNVAAAATGTVSNTATVTAPAGVTDPTPGNNSATDTDTLAASADLAITATDGVTTATPGGSVTYTITASNAGPSNAAGATVADTFPASLTCTWTCLGAGGGTCTASGAGNINGTVNLPAGASVTYTASCNVAAAATGTVSNTATVTAPAGVTDPTPGNNSATDTDTITQPLGATVTGTKTVSGGPYAVGGTVTYTVTLHNSGAGAQADNPGNEFTDILPGGLTLVSATASSGAAAANTGSNTVTWNGAIPAGGSVTITITATILASAAGETVSNQGSISYDSDGNGTNDATAVTDDPGVGGPADPTNFTVAATSAPIPTLSTLGLLLLALGLGGAAFVRLRRRKTA